MHLVHQSNKYLQAFPEQESAQVSEALLLIMLYDIQSIPDRVFTLWSSKASICKGLVTSVIN
jgi:hypothetical protein